MQINEQQIHFEMLDSKKTKNCKQNKTNNFEKIENSGKILKKTYTNKIEFRVDKRPKVVDLPGQTISRR